MHSIFTQTSQNQISQIGCIKGNVPDLVKVQALLANAESACVCATVLKVSDGRAYE